MAEFKHGEFSIEVDTTDAEFVEKYEKAAEVYNDKIAKMPKVGYESEKLRYICGVIFEFFDSIFGTGTHVAMFGGKESGRECMAAFAKLIEAIKSDNEIESIARSLSPSRGARRKAAKGGASVK